MRVCVYYFTNCLFISLTDHKNLSAYLVFFFLPRYNSQYKSYSKLVELTNNGLMDMNGECMMYDWTSG